MHPILIAAIIVFVLNAAGSFIEFNNSVRERARGYGPVRCSVLGAYPFWLFAYGVFGTSSYSGRRTNRTIVYVAMADQTPPAAPMPDILSGIIRHVLTTVGGALVAAGA